LRRFWPPSEVENDRLPPTHELRMTYADIRKFCVAGPPYYVRGNYAIYARNKRTTHELRKVGHDRAWGGAQC
jgi:hypothetical protein